MAVEKAGVSSSSFQKLPEGDNSTDLASLSISSNGPELLEAILNTRFRGINGAFQLVNGQLQSSVFEIVNVIGKGARQISVLDAEFEISKLFNSTSPANLRDCNMAWGYYISAEGMGNANQRKEAEDAQYRDMMRWSATQQSLPTDHWERLASNLAESGGGDMGVCRLDPYILGTQQGLTSNAHRAATPANGH
ncbi:hypothetical protein J5N97_003333 [Dioscorea zingiberensis]|uniref:Uncharacterized protein n=1 Tax=Dioscorea zingiberensis TaxID=325984 RepID=A0A9D5HR58_9LILI|nr:hypothetical protein J5N97_003333 [Dioscorea zingiberensis]